MKRAEAHAGRGASPVALPGKGSLSPTSEAEPSRGALDEERPTCILEHLLDAVHALAETDAEPSFVSCMQFWKRLLMAFAAATAAEDAQVQAGENPSAEGDSLGPERRHRTDEAEQTNAVAGERGTVVSRRLCQLARHIRLAIVFRDMLVRYCERAAHRADAFSAAAGAVPSVCDAEENLSERTQRLFRWELKQRRQKHRSVEDEKHMHATLFLSVALLEIWSQQLEVTQRDAGEKGKNAERSETESELIGGAPFLAVLAEVRAAVTSILEILGEERACEAHVSCEGGEEKGQTEEGKQRKAKAGRT